LKAFLSWQVWLDTVGAAIQDAFTGGASGMGLDGKDGPKESNQVKQDKKLQRSPAQKLSVFLLCLYAW
jgi:hypothetical protein